MKKTTSILLFSLFTQLIFCVFQPAIAQVSEPVEVPPPPTPSVEEIFRVVENMPNFPGCADTLSRSEKKQCVDEKMNEYIYANLKYPTLARENGIEGTVVIRYYVDKDGRIRAPQLLKDIGAGCGQEALRVIKSMDNVTDEKWTPGKSRGKPVKVYFNLPIEFDLEKSKNPTTKEFFEVSINIKYKKARQMLTKNLKL